MQPEAKFIPVFPLQILPFPTELVPLHIYEPRYRQLLFDAESKDISFGIYCQNKANTAQFGALVKLESVIKRYPSGEADIIVKGLDIFNLTTIAKHYRDKQYPGAEVKLWGVNPDESVLPNLLLEYVEYMAQLKMYHHPGASSQYQIAAELNLSVPERIQFLETPLPQREKFLHRLLRYQTELLISVEKAKDVFHLN